MGQSATCPDKLGRLGHPNSNVYVAVRFPVKLIRARGSLPEGAERPTSMPVIFQSCENLPIRCCDVETSFPFGLLNKLGATPHCDWSIWRFLTREVSHNFEVLMSDNICYLLLRSVISFVYLICYPPFHCQGSVIMYASHHIIHLLIRLFQLTFLYQ